MIPKTERLQKYKKLHVFAYGIGSELQDLFYSFSPLKIDFCGLGSRVGVDRAYQGIRYGVLGFLGVGTTFDIFQNIHILYLQYGVLGFTGYGVLNLFPLWSLVSAGQDLAVSSLMDTAYW
ncbi:hypothetical protein Tco_0913185 [Tanacetum coccineum]